MLLAWTMVPRPSWPPAGWFSRCRATPGDPTVWTCAAAGLILDAVKIAGGELDPAETVTMLNDLCILAPAALVGPSFSWEAANDRSAKVTFQNGPHRVSAQLLFDAEGDLVNFISDDRGALQDDGTLKRFRWSTPVGEYRAYGGRRLASRGAAIWHYPEGDFTYRTFTLRSIEYNVSDYRLE